jgi:hypothetical protein
VLARVPALRRRHLTWLTAVICGLAATILSGEFRVSWGFVLVDVPLVAVSCQVGILLHRRRRTAPEDL